MIAVAIIGSAVLVAVLWYAFEAAKWAGIGLIIGSHCARSDE